jgi:sialidase-1
MTRRTLLAGTAALARAASATPRANVRTIQTISAQLEFYHGWPTLARSRNGDLLVAYSGGREAHVCPFGRVELIRSSDEGRSWSWPQVLMDSPIDDRDAGIVETRTGTLLVTTFTSLAYEPQLAKATSWPADRLARWQAVQRRASSAERRALLGSWILRSTDGGMTWSAPFRTPLNSPHGPVALKDGRLIYAGKQLWSGEKVGVAESSDDGATWRWLSDIPARPGDDALQYHELHAVEATDGRILVHIRNHNQANAGETLQSESADGGRTWSTPHAIGVWGLPSHLLRLGNGNLLMSYGHRRPPFGNQARLSVDNGLSWPEPMTISADAPGNDVGYPSTVELAGGDLLTVWYETTRDSTRAVLRQARWSVVK